MSDLNSDNSNNIIPLLANIQNTLLNINREINNIKMNIKKSRRYSIYIKQQ